MERNKTTVLFAGGGTIGPVTPLLAIYDEMKKTSPEFSYQWVGTTTGPERELVAEKHLTFHTLPSVKIDRFISGRNLIMPFRMIFACIQAWKLLKLVKPSLIVTAGGFVAVPLVWMAKVKGIPAHIHQLDVRPGLANKLMMPFAKTISVTFSGSLQDFPKGKTTVTGAPVREQVLQSTTDTFSFANDKPIIFVFGGGTGAQALNEFVWGSLEELTNFCNIIHLTGRDKSADLHADGYIQKEFLTNEMAEAYKKADLVVTRGGLGTFLELAALKKPAVVIPIPNSHQEDNAAVLWEAKAALVLDQTTLSPQLFAAQIRKLLESKEKQNNYAKAISHFYQKDAAKKIVEILQTSLSEVAVQTPMQEIEQKQPPLEKKEKPLSLKDVKKVHFVGIGGIGISFVAHFFLDKGVFVSGSDLNQSIVTDQLAKAGAVVLKGHDAANIKEDIDLVVYNDAIPLDNPELKKAKEMGIPMRTNFQIVGALSKSYKTVVIAGNKGKTTTTAMLSHILAVTGCDPTAMVGSIVNDWKCNFRSGKSDLLIVEGDEFKEHFLEIDTDIAVITNMAPDHMDYYETEENLIRAFQTFVDRLPEDGLLLINKENEMIKRLNLPEEKTIRFSSKGEADISAYSISSKNKQQLFSIKAEGQDLGQFSLPFPGVFNVENAMAALAIALYLDVEPEDAKRALASFKGTWRRFQILGEYKEAVIVSDYAHHPTAVHATIQGAKEFYEGQRIVAVFQAHTRHRTKSLFEDFVKSFDLADIVLIPDIFDVAGRETISKEEMNALMLADAIRARGRVDQVIASGTLQQTKTTLDSHLQPGDIVLMMGAGDIYRLAEELV